MTGPKKPKVDLKKPKQTPHQEGKPIDTDGGNKSFYGSFGYSRGTDEVPEETYCWDRDWD